VSPTVVPLPETAISRFKARTRERKTPYDREQHYELTKDEIEGMGWMEATLCSIWRTVVAR
jgi:hypothetical protein